MNQRLIIALILSLLVMFIYQALVTKKEPRKIPEQRRGEIKEREEERVDLRRELPKIVKEEKRPLGDVKYSDVIIDTPLYTASFTTYGGRLKSWKLKKYMDNVPMHPMGKFVQNLVGSILGKNKKEDTPPEPIDIVNTKELQELPLAIRFGKERIGYDETIPFTSSSEAIQLTQTGDQEELTFKWKSPSGVQIEKRMKFYADSYTLDMDVVILNSTDKGLGREALELEWRAEAGEKTRYYGFFGPIYYTGGGLQRIKPKKIKENENIVSEVEWFALDEDYFIAMIYPTIQKTTLVLRRYSEKIINATLITGMDIKPREKVTMAYTLFLGPKISHLLSKINPTAKKAINYGWFSVIAVPILKILKFTNKFTGNYGVDIIILAIFLKIIFTPLTHKSQQSMKAMQKLQPEIKKIQQKYKNDRQRLNQEVMELYKRRKVNPFSGCFPMLLQIPVFFALYRALLNSIELWHSPFTLWIRDLADKDPTYISPLLMGGTMFFQQRMSTVTADPTQAKMMSLMPIFFTFIFLNFPSGLVLYWLVTNVLSIGHQYYINRRK
jgi:YidC/Oxa1 family membrane protein insertase